MKKLLLCAMLAVTIPCVAVVEVDENIYHIENHMKYGIWLTFDRGYGINERTGYELYKSTCNLNNGDIFTRWSKENPLPPGQSGQFHAGKYMRCCGGNKACSSGSDYTHADKVPFFIRSITVHWIDENGQEQSVKNAAKDILQRAGRVGNKMYGSWNFQIGKFNIEGRDLAIQNGKVFTWWNWPGEATRCEWPEGCSE